MSAQKEPAILADSTIPIADLANRIREEMIPLNSVFAYFFLSATPSEEEVKEYLEEPVAGLPPAVVTLLPRTHLVFVPFLEKASGKMNGRRYGGELVSLARPSRPLSGARASFPNTEVLLFPFEDRDAAEYHHRFFQFIATLVSERWPEPVEKNYLSLIRQELRNNVHGEVDETSWERKMELLERQSLFHGTNKALRDYARQSFVDTMTLYLHGICCDLDVDTGPRQLASRHLRKRLEMLEEFFPPPSGYAVFPEEMKSPTN